MSDHAGRAMWFVKKNIIRTKVFKLADKWGGGDREWLNAYVDDITNRPLNELEEVMEALDDLLRSNYYMEVLRGTKPMDKAE